MSDEEGTTDDVDSKALQDLSQVFDDIKGAFPPPERDSRMYLLCKLNSGDLVLVEVQVVTQKMWDKRALPYCASAYAHQLRKGGKWEYLRQVIAVNLLGKGVDEEDPWKDSPKEFCRHYRFVTEGSTPVRVIDHLQLIQYYIPHLKEGINTFPDEQKQRYFSEWADFFQTAHLRSEADVSLLSSEPVKRAYKRARISDFPEVVKAAYLDEELKFDQCAESVKMAREEAAVARQEAAEARAELRAIKATSAMAMLGAGMEVQTIAEAVQLTVDQVEALRK